MKSIALIAILLATGPAPIALDPAIHDTGAYTLADASGADYVAKKLPFAPANAVKLELEARFGKVLKDRGEAHVTLVTPPEFAVLKDKVGRSEILAEGADLGVQSDAFGVVCVGKGTKVENGETLETYFLVIDEPALKSYRERLRTLYLQRGGAPEAFDAATFYPHVTLGFTKRDLHLEDGVVKDRSSCVLPVSE